MAISLVDTAFWHVNGTSTSVTWPSTLAAGDLALILLSSLSSIAPAGATNFTLIRKQTNIGNARPILLVYDPSAQLSEFSGGTSPFQNATSLTGSESGSLTVSWSATGQVNGTLVILRGAGGQWKVQGGGDGSLGNNAAYSFSNMTDAQSGDYLVANTQLQNSNTATWSAPAFTATGITVGSRTNLGSGSYGGGAVYGAPVTAGNQTGGLTFTANSTSSSDNCTGVGALIRQVASSFDPMGMMGFFGM